MPDYVIGDNIRINQILMNIAGNALKFTTEGEVTIAIKKIAQRGEPDTSIFCKRDGKRDTCKQI